jgi:hypothetical protein
MKKIVMIFSLVMGVALLANASSGKVYKLNVYKTKATQTKAIDAKSIPSLKTWQVTYNCGGGISIVVGGFSSYTAANEYLQNHPWSQMCTNN